MRKVSLYTLFLCLFQVFCHAQCTNPVTSVTANFNNGSTPPCWTLSPSHLTSVSGSNIRSSNNNVDQYIVLPRTTNASGVLEFDCAREVFTGTLIINVGVMSNPNNPSSFINRQTIHITSFQNAWTHQTVNLSSYTGSYQYVAIKFTRSTVNPYGIMRFDNFVYNSLCTPSYNLYVRDTICSGDSYTFPDGSTQSNITAGSTQTSSLQTTQGCDSIIYTTLTINPTYSNTVQHTICPGSSYTFPDGSTQNNITAATTQTSTLQTIKGCDSTIITNLTIAPTYSITVQDTLCPGSNYTFPDGSTQNNITTATTQTSTLQTIQGCDSTIITNLVIAPTYSITVQDTICSGSSYTFPDGSTQNNITTATTQTSTLQTIQGCDSIVTTNLVIAPTYSITVQDTICPGSSYTFPDGSTQNNITTATTQTSTLQTMQGCDSIVMTNIVMAPTYSITVQDTICTGGSYTFPDGSTQSNITTVTTQTSTLQTMQGCDSIIITTVQPVSLDNSTTLTGITLSANQSGANYQWLDCNNSNTAIAGATSATFTPINNGDYAVEITLGGCVDTSSCTNVLVSSLSYTTSEQLVQIYPNPAHNILHINSPNLAIEQVEILDFTGRVLKSCTITGQQIHIEDLISGHYILRLVADQKTLHIPFNKQ